LPERAGPEIRAYRSGDLIVIVTKQPDDTLIAVLVEALQGADLLVSAAMVASRLAARGVVVTAAQVEQIFTRYGLEPGKKTVG